MRVRSYSRAKDFRFQIEVPSDTLQVEESFELEIMQLEDEPDIGATRLEVPSTHSLQVAGMRLPVLNNSHMNSPRTVGPILAVSGAAESCHF